VLRIIKSAVTPACMLRCCMHVGTYTHTPLTIPPFNWNWLSQQQNSQGPNKRGLEGFCLL
jgi:hypothetical protein